MNKRLLIVLAGSASIGTVAAVLALRIMDPQGGSVALTPAPTSTAIASDPGSAPSDGQNAIDSVVVSSPARRRAAVLLLGITASRLWEATMYRDEQRQRMWNGATRTLSLLCRELSISLPHSLPILARATSESSYTASDKVFKELSVEVRDHIGADALGEFLVAEMIQDLHMKVSIWGAYQMGKVSAAGINAAVAKNREDLARVAPRLSSAPLRSLVEEVVGILQAFDGASERYYNIAMMILHAASTTIESNYREERYTL